MRLKRITWSILNVPALLLLCLLGALAELCTWTWLEDRCDRWIEETEKTRP